MVSFFKNLVIATAFASTSAFAGVAFTGSGNITYVENGWIGDGFSIYHTQSVAGCTAAGTQYSLLISHPQYKEIVALMMMAYSNSTPVEFVVDQGNCGLGGRTNIVSIRLGQ